MLEVKYKFGEFQAYLEGEMSADRGREQDVLRLLLATGMPEEVMIQCISRIMANDGGHITATFGGLFVLADATSATLSISQCPIEFSQLLEHGLGVNSVEAFIIVSQLEGYVLTAADIAELEEVAELNAGEWLTSCAAA